MATNKTARVAKAEDWDSDESAAKPGTAIHAQAGRRAQQSSPRTIRTTTERASRRQDVPASDSGYSSHASQSLAARSPAPAPATASSRKGAQQSVGTTASPSKSRPKPVIRQDSTQTISKPAPPQREQCFDPNCRDPNCPPSRITEPRYTLPKQPAQQSQSGTPSRQQQAQPAQYTAMPRMQSNSQAMPPPARPRPRLDGQPRARPQSFHGYSYPSYSGAQAGPPTSSAAYYYQNFAQPYVGYGTTPPAYTSTSPTAPIAPLAPTMAAYGGVPDYAHPYSARSYNPAGAGLNVHRAAAPGLSRTLSARARPDEQYSRVPGAYPEAEAMYSGSSSDTDSSISDYSQRQRRRSSRRDSRRDSYAREKDVAATPSRRPSMSKRYYTENSLAKSRKQSRPRESLQRSNYSDTNVEYPSSSDRNDSDRTARADVGYRRNTTTSSRSSRRPSVSTTASSGHTKATSLSSGTEYSRVIVEGANGRRIHYLSKHDQDRLIRQLHQAKLNDEQRLEERIADYQNRTSGGAPFDLTADNVKRANRKSGSHLSHRSQKSAGSGSKSRADGIQIKSGDTVLHVYGDAKIEMRPSEDGGPAHLVIASSSGRDSAYGTSKSSDSRMGRSRGRSERAVKRDSIREEA